MKKTHLYISLIIALFVSLSVERFVLAQGDDPVTSTPLELEGGIRLYMPEGWAVDATLAPTFVLLASDEAVLEATEAIPNAQAVIITAMPTFMESPELRAQQALLDYDPEADIDTEAITLRAINIGDYDAAISTPLTIVEETHTVLLRAAVIRIQDYDVLLLRVAIENANEAQFEALVNSIQIEETAFLAAMPTSIRVIEGELFAKRALISREVTGFLGDLAIDVPPNWQVQVKDGAIAVGSSLAFLDFLARGNLTEPTERTGAGLNIVYYPAQVVPPDLRAPQPLMDALLAQIDQDTNDVTLGQQRTLRILGGFGIQQSYSTINGEGVITILLIDDQVFLQMNAFAIPSSVDTTMLLQSIVEHMRWVAPNSP
ncbi:MAG: hypothetical protein CUN55_07255 [Phototrophicales bacterium]|nr:MAG: hypothetical protein CUN55_07255 [Phototrophicales bacterium]